MEQKYLMELGGKLVGRLLDFSGGEAVAEVATMRGPGLVSHKHIAAVKFEDITIACGTGMSKAFYDWIGSAFQGQTSRTDGAVMPLDNQSKAVSRIEFSQALITSVTLPELNRSGNKEASMAVSFRPQFTRTAEPAAAQNLGAYTGALQKAWKIADFRVLIDDLDTECRYVDRIESIKVTQDTVIDAVGERRDTVNQPGKTTVPDVVLYLPDKYAKGFYDWHRRFVVDGNSGSDQEKKGSIDFFAPGSSSPYFGLKLTGLGMVSMSSIRGARPPGSMEPVKVEMYCDTMTFSAGAAAIK